MFKNVNITVISTYYYYILVELHRKVPETIEIPMVAFFLCEIRFLLWKWKCSQTIAQCMVSLFHCEIMFILWKRKCPQKMYNAWLHCSFVKKRFMLWKYSQTRTQQAAVHIMFLCSCTMHGCIVHLWNKDSFCESESVYRQLQNAWLHCSFLRWKFILWKWECSQTIVQYSCMVPLQ